MTHKFDYRNKHKLDDEKRRQHLPPYKILTELGLSEGDVMADIGCGIGYFTFPAAEIVGETGKVFALDISAEMIEEVEKRIEANEVYNIRPVITEENELKVDSEAVTFAFICVVLHEVEDVERFIHEVKRILADGGKIAIVEWDKEESDWGPSLSHRLDKGYVKSTLEGAGFNNVTITQINEFFYAVTGEK